MTDWGSPSHACWPTVSTQDQKQCVPNAREHPLTKRALIDLLCFCPADLHVLKMCLQNFYRDSLHNALFNCFPGSIDKRKRLIERHYQQPRFCAKKCSAWTRSCLAIFLCCLLMILTNPSIDRFTGVTLPLRLHQRHRCS